MEGLGQKLKDARLARNLTLEEAGRLTKIRPGRLQEIENEDFSEFASLAYAKGFLLIYGKFLDVDVSPYLEAFETSESMTVDGYAYLQDNPAPKPSRQSVTRRPHGGGGGGGGGMGSFLPLIIGVVVLVGGFMVMKWIVEIKRLKPSPRQVVGVAPATAAAAPEGIIAPRALPADNLPNPTPAAVIAPTPEPTFAPPTPTVRPASAEPEVRRAEPVHPEEVPVAKPTPTPVIRKPVRVAPPNPVRTAPPNAVPRVSPAPRPIPRPGGR